MAESDKTEPGKHDRLKDALEKLSKPTAFELSVVRALHDIHRRVIEEPWYGRTIHDVVSYYNQRLGKERSPGKEPEREPAQENAQQQEKGAEHEPGHDYSPDTFYGRDKTTTERRQEREQQEEQRTREQGRERGRDIER